MSINQISFRPLSWLKNLILTTGKGRRPYLIHFGLYKGLRLDLDLRNHAQIYFGLYEHETYQHIRSTAATVNWMVDIGAGSGELCLYFLKNSHANRIIAIEPQATEITILQSNLALNGEQGSQRLSILKKFAGTSHDPDFISLDKLDIPMGKRGFIKIDVEGAEYDVLKSGEQLIVNEWPDILVETHSAILENNCINWLLDKGYQCKVLKNAWWRFVLTEYRPITHNRWIWATQRAG